MQRPKSTSIKFKNRFLVRIIGFGVWKIFSVFFQSLSIYQSKGKRILVRFSIIIKKWIDIPSQLNLKGDDYLLMKFNVSEDEFWEIATEDSNFELINGVLMIHSPASTEHEQIFGYLYFVLHYYTEQTEKGRVFGSRLVMRLSEKWNPEPDLMVVIPEHYDRIMETRIQGPADIAIEILSPTTREIDLTKKLPHYRYAGIGEVWNIDPKSQEFMIYWEKE